MSVHLEDLVSGDSQSSSSQSCQQQQMQQMLEEQRNKVRLRQQQTEANPPALVEGEGLVGAYSANEVLDNFDFNIPIAIPPAGGQGLDPSQPVHIKFSALISCSMQSTLCVAVVLRILYWVVATIRVEKDKPPSSEEMLWATVMVCLWLREKMMDIQEEWGLMEEKAVRIVDSLLNGRSKEDVEKHARDILGF
ncbi:hypothetical protein K440DRAFT_664135 [Wilcoxina mikolae CBS 423.85]|nr:hypothetical protein K440DRAFT_664135 [Wilcoxina mikolae CBS 423.85]